jgi:hypothetical protein
VKIKQKLKNREGSSEIAIQITNANRRKSETSKPLEISETIATGVTIGMTAAIAMTEIIETTAMIATTEIIETITVGANNLTAISKRIYIKTAGRTMIASKNGVRINMTNINAISNVIVETRIGVGSRDIGSACTRIASGFKTLDITIV